MRSNRLRKDADTKYKTQIDLITRNNLSVTDAALEAYYKLGESQ